jgi:hypothetical protein
MGRLRKIESGLFNCPKESKTVRISNSNDPNLKIGCFRLDGAHANRGLGRGINLFWKT